jgi:hypothetical protein
LSTGVPPWQTAYERAARETFVIVLLASGAAGLVAVAVWATLRYWRG